MVVELSIQLYLKMSWSSKVEIQTRKYFLENTETSRDEETRSGWLWYFYTCNWKHYQDNPTILPYGNGPPPF